jgi:hypothetical protein
MSEYAARPRQPIDVEEFERRLRVSDRVEHEDDSDPLAELARLVANSDDVRPSTAQDNRPGPVPVEPAAVFAPPPPPPAPPQQGWRPREVVVEPPPVQAAPAAPAAPVAADAWDDDLRGWEEELRGMVAGGVPAPQPVKDAPRVAPAPAPVVYAEPEPVSHEAPTHAYDDDQSHYASEHVEPQYADAHDQHIQHEDPHDAFERAVAGAVAASHVEEPEHQPRDLDEGRDGWRHDEPRAEDEFERHLSANHISDRDFDASQAERPRSRKPLIWITGATLAIVAAVGGTFALKGGIGGKKDAPTILAASGPAKIQPETQPNATDSTPTGGVFDRKNDKIGASRVVSNEEQPVDLVAQARAKAAANGSTAPGAGAPAAGYFPEPRRVKTVSVRPDGSIIDGDVLPPRQVAAVQPPTRPAAATPAPTPSTPAPLAATPKPVAPKTTARVTTPKADDGDAATPAAAPVRPKPTPKPIVAAAADSRPTAGGGGYSVQFAAAGSDAEARDRIAKVQSQFGSALGGHRPSVVKGEANGKTVYRVRVGGVSKDDAVAMCTKVKESGGSCFVAGT